MTIGESAKQQYFRMLEAADPDFSFEIAVLGWEETYAKYDEGELQRRYYLKVGMAGQQQLTAALQGLKTNIGKAAGK